MITILGVLGFCGLTGVIYWLFYRLLWNSAADQNNTFKPLGNRKQASGKGAVGKGKPGRNVPGAANRPSPAAGHHH
jgi:hypothetical protein